MQVQPLLQQLSKASGIGHQLQVFDVIKSFLPSVFSVKEQEQYLLAQWNCGAEKTILLEAHVDEVGMIVTEVQDDGFLSVAPVGSLDGRFLPSMPVKVLGKKTGSGVFTSVPPHIKKGETVPDFENCYIDTGIKNIGEIISLGDIAVFDAKPIWISDNRITSKALDNRAGVAAVISAGERLAKANCPVNVVLLFPMGEELGLRGARVATFGLDIDESISVDVSFGDCPDVSESKTAKLGSGAMIGVSPVLSRNIYKKLKATAEDKKLPHTLEVMGGNTSTDADIITLSGSGIPSGLASIPLRNMHTPVEVADLRDVEATASLLYEYVLGGGLND